MSEPTIESLLRQVRTRGMRVNNLFQREDGAWQANVRDRGSMLFFEFATGVTAAEALTNALAKVETDKSTAAKHLTDSNDDSDLDPTVVGHARHDLPVQRAAESDDLIG